MKIIKIACLSLAFILGITQSFGQELELLPRLPIIYKALGTSDGAGGGTLEERIPQALEEVFAAVETTENILIEQASISKQAKNLYAVLRPKLIELKKNVEIKIVDKPLYAFRSLLNRSVRVQAVAYATKSLIEIDRELAEDLSGIRLDSLILHELLHIAGGDESQEKVLWEIADATMGIWIGLPRFGNDPFDPRDCGKMGSLNHRLRHCEKMFGTLATKRFRDKSHKVFVWKMVWRSDFKEAWLDLKTNLVWTTTFGPAGSTQPSHTALSRCTTLHQRADLPSLEQTKIAVKHGLALLPGYTRPFWIRDDLALSVGLIGTNNTVLSSPTANSAYSRCVIY